MNGEGRGRDFVVEFGPVERGRLHEASNEAVMPMRRTPVGMNPPGRLGTIGRRDRRHGRGLGR